jgi:hypothetical protein
MGPDKHNPRLKKEKKKKENPAIGKSLLLGIFPGNSQHFTPFGDCRPGLFHARIRSEAETITPTSHGCWTCRLSLPES